MPTNIWFKVNGSDVSETIIGSNQATGPFGDNLYGVGGNDFLIGGVNSDILVCGTGVDTLEGRVGNDRYYVDNVDDIVTELNGSGVDAVFSTISFSLADSFHARGVIENIQLKGVLAINGKGTEIANRIEGNSGDNVLDGGAGNDTLMYTGGVDTLIGSDDIDVADYTNFSWAVLVDLAAPTQYTRGTSDLYSGTWTSIGTTTGIENLRGTLLNDTLYGDANDNTVFYTGGLDNYDGRGGFDTLDFTAFASATYLDLDHAAQCTRDAGNIFSGIWQALAYTVASSFENAAGTSASDYILGSAADNKFTYTGGLDDSYTGLRGADTLDLSRQTNAVYSDLQAGTTYDRANANWNVGSVYNRIVFTNTIENIIGGSGGDYLAGSTGINNTLTGGAAADSFVLRPNSGAYDVITDFQDGIDRIRLEHYGAGGSFSHLQIVYDANGAYFSNDTDPGDYVRVSGLANGSLTAADFDFIV